MLTQFEIQFFEEKNLNVKDAKLIFKIFLKFQSLF